MQQMVRDHEKTLDLFESESQNGKDAEIREWAASKLPALREYLRVAREVYSKAYRLSYLASRQGPR